MAQQKAGEMGSKRTPIKTKSATNKPVAAKPAPKGAKGSHKPRG